VDTGLQIQYLVADRHADKRIFAMANDSVGQVCERKIASSFVCGLDPASLAHSYLDASISSLAA
jgi:hypothetical protein